MSDGPRQHLCIALSQGAVTRGSARVRSERFGLALATVGVVLSSTAPAAAGPLRLGEAVKMAVDASPALGPRRADVRVADARVLEAAGMDDFIVRGEGSYAHAESKAPLGGQAIENDAIAGTATVTRPLATGGRLGLRFDMPWSRVLYPSDASAPGTGVPTSGFTPSLALTFTQPLLRGRGYDVARAPQRRARVGREVAARDLEGGVNVLVREVTIRYWELAFATDMRAVRRANEADAQEQLRAVRANIEVGKQPATAAAEVLVAVALRADEVIATDAMVAARAAELGELLGVDPERSMAIEPVERPAEDIEGIDVASALTRAVARNPEVASLRAQARRAAVDVDVTRNGMLPAVDVFVAGGPAGASTEGGRALRDAVSFRGWAAQAGLTIETTVERRAQRGARDAALALAGRLEASERELVARIGAAVASGAAALDASLRRATNLAHGVEVAELDLEGERARFVAGRSTNFDVLRRQQILADARLRLLRAKTDRAEAAVVLDALTGDLLARHALVTPAGDVR